ncbi:hypothetical protein IAU60_001543 [Kwoniella sp. DSM 27419]
MASTASTVHADGDAHSIKSSQHDHPEHPAVHHAVPRQGSLAVSPTPTVSSEGAEKKSPAPPAGMSAVHAPVEISKPRFWAIMISLMLCVFLFALDQLIVATAIPKITAEFNSLTQLSWLASGFFLTLLGFNLLYSQWMNIFPSKHVILFAVFIFEIGSLVCGVAPSMEVLIFGRALAGVGAAGIFSGAMVVIAEITSLASRAKYFALFGVCFAIASVIGPLIGGAFADHVSWRWCFYINLPLGGVAMASLFVFQPARPPLGRGATYKGYSKAMFMQVIRCDWVGVTLSMGWGCAFILFTQWGGVTKSWDNAGVVVCAVLSGVLPIIFCVYEWWAKDNAYFRIRLLMRRNIAGACILCFNVFGVFMILVYYLSLAYQAVYHSSATGAGVRLLPLILIQVFFLILSSRIIPKIGRFKPVLLVGCVLLCIAAGLFYTIKDNDKEANLYGFQVLLGAGIGCVLQNSMIAVQHELSKEPWLISLGTGLAVFIGFAGRIVALSMSGSVFENQIQKNLRAGVPGIPDHLVQAVVHSAAAVWEDVPVELQPLVLKAYTKTLSQVFLIAVPMAICALGGALLMKNDQIVTKKDEQAAKDGAKEKEADAAVALKEEEIAVGVAGVGDAQPAIDAELGQNEKRVVDEDALKADRNGRSAV